jgi:DNA-binding MarR family transcriptional regulator
VAEVSRGEEAERTRIMLGILESVGRDGSQTQRHLAAELGVALGLVNAYLKRCVSKGLVKVRQAPARRYAYYLTPRGLSQKSRLTVEYLSYSFSFFRQARSECAEIFAIACGRGFKRVALAGISDLAEIARICALECGIEIVAVVDSGAEVTVHLGLPVVADLDNLTGTVDAVIVTDVRNPQDVYANAAALVGRNRVFAPKLLGLRPQLVDGGVA